MFLIQKVQVGYYQPTSGLCVEALRGDCVNFIDEDYGRCVLLGETEDIADHPRAFAEVFLDELGANHADKGRCSVMRHGFGQHCLATAGRAKHEDTTRRINADLLVQLKVRQWQLYRFSHLLLLNVHAAYINVGHVRLFI